MTNSVETTHRPSRWTIALHATLLGAAIGVLVWLVASLPEHRRWYDWLGIMAWTALVVLDLVALVKVIHRRRMPTSPTPTPTGYVDRDGGQWTVREDGDLDYHGGVWPPDVVEREFGPLTPIYG